MSVDRAPEARVPIALEAEIISVGKLKQGAVSIRLKVEPKRYIEPADSKVKPPDIVRTPCIVHQRIKDVIKVQIEVVIFERPSLPSGTLHIIGHGIVPIAPNQPPLKVKARNRGGGTRKFLQHLESDRLAARPAAVAAPIKLRHDFLSESEILAQETANP